MTTITEALRAARACIQQDRTSLADTGMRHDNTMEPDAAAGVAEYDAVLQQIDAALAGITHHITDEQIEQAYEAEMRQSLHPQSRATLIRVCRAVLAIAAPAPAVPSGWSIADNSDGTITVQGPGMGCIVSDVEANERRVPGEVLHALCRAMLTAAPTPPAQPASAPAAMNADLMQEAKTAIELAMDNLRSHGDNCFLHDDGEYDACFCGLDSLSDYLQSTVEAIEGAISAPAAEQPAVPEDVAREPMAEKWCWWIGDAETFHVADTESEAHSEAQSRIDDDCEPGGTHEYSVGRVQHPIDALGMEWLAEHAAETIEENACCWCDDNTGAEDPSITLAAEDKQALGTMVAAFLREKAAAHWWTADQKTITTHTHVAGSAEGGDAARAAEKGGE